MFGTVKPEDIICPECNKPLFGKFMVNKLHCFEHYSKSSCSVVSIDYNSGFFEILADKNDCHISCDGELFLVYDKVFNFNKSISNEKEAYILLKKYIDNIEFK